MSLHSITIDYNYIDCNYARPWKLLRFICKLTSSLLTLFINLSDATLYCQLFVWESDLAWRALTFSSRCEPLKICGRADDPINGHCWLPRRRFYAVCILIKEHRDFTNAGKHLVSMTYSYTHRALLTLSSQTRTCSRASARAVLVDRFNSQHTRSIRPRTVISHRLFSFRQKLPALHTLSTSGNRAIRRFFFPTNDETYFSACVLLAASVTVNHSRRCSGRLEIGDR